MLSLYNKKNFFNLLAQFLIIVFLFCLSFFLRVYFSYNSFFSEPLKYSFDDGVYHMRIVENQLLGGHFPSRIFFDPFTNFPNGTFIHFGPLYDYLLSFIIWFLSFGKPTQDIINSVAPYYPPLLGSLAILVVYFIGKRIGGFWVGFLAGLISSLSSALIFRSVLGSTDHHVAEYLFSSLGVLFFLQLLQYEEKEKQYSFKWWLTVLFVSLSFSLYLLMWEGGILFFALLFVFSILHIILNFLQKKEWAYIAISRSIIFLTALFSILPFLKTPNIYLSPVYNLLHVGSLLFSFVFLFSLFVFRLYLLRKKLIISNIVFFAYLIFLSFFSLFLVILFFPEAINFLKNGFYVFDNSAIPYKNAKEIVLEMKPLGIKGFLGLVPLISFLSFCSFFLFLILFLKEKKPFYLFLLIWFLVALTITGFFGLFGQNKYIYYFNIVACVFSAYFLKKSFLFAWRGLKLYDLIKKENKVLSSYILSGSILTILILVYLIFYPFPFNLFNNFPDNLPYLIVSAINSAKNVIKVNDDYYEVFSWIKKNTPEVSLNYYDLYNFPFVDLENKKIYPYNYSPQDYGILARWDIGHSLLYYTHRPVIANNFQQGIGRKENGNVLEPGSELFFIENDEEKALDYLNQLRARYILTTADHAHTDFRFLGSLKWFQDDLSGYTEETLKEGPNKFETSMITRLHIFDGTSFEASGILNGTSTKFKIEPLSNFRLVYESKSKSPYHNGDIKMVKVFEYVKGAKIIGLINSDKEIKASIDITTNQGRMFTYEKTVFSKNGKFEFTVPYVGEYKIKYGSLEKKVLVKEEDVLNGNTISLYLY
jgi:dolichyl-diphosphooligosaccharide--protein glycosyltransferase